MDSIGQYRDGYHVYDETEVGGINVYTATNYTNNTGQELNNQLILNSFYNKSISDDGELGRLPYSPITSAPFVDKFGDSQDVLDYIFGYDGVGARPGGGNYTGFTPFKEYRNFFRTYKCFIQFREFSYHNKC